MARTYIDLLEKENVFEDSIVTEIVKFEVFYNAENNHQDYYDNNKEQPYCQVMISPKIKKLKTHYTDKLK